MTVALHKAHSHDVWEVMDSILGPYRVRCATLRVGVGKTPWPKTGETHFLAQLGPPEVKGHAIKRLFSAMVLAFGPALQSDLKFLSIVP